MSTEAHIWIEDEDRNLIITGLTPAERALLVRVAELTQRGDMRGFHVLSQGDSAKSWFRGWATSPENRWRDYCIIPLSEAE